MATHFALCDRPESGGYNRGPVMRYLVGFLRVCGLVLIAFIACIDFGGGDDDGQACGLGENKCKDVVCDDDGNECTRDCNPATGRCDYSPVYDGRECDFDGLPGVCIFGVCEEDSCAGVVCDDGDECTQDVCDFRTGQCDYTVMYDGADCDFDGLAGVCTSGVCNQKYLCEGVDCDDGDECTQDVCIDATGTCDYAPAADGTACNGGLGLCADGVCDMLCVANFCRCSEAGIRAAIQAGGNQPYTFDCDGPKTVVTNSTIEIYNDVILNGEGNLTVDASYYHRVFAVGELVTVELRGFTVSGGKVVGEFGGGIANGGDLTPREQHRPGERGRVTARTLRRRSLRGWPRRGHLERWRGDPHSGEHHRFGEHRRFRRRHFPEWGDADANEQHCVRKHRKRRWRYLQ